MQKKIIILFVSFIIFSTSIFGLSVKFDVSARGNIGQMNSMGSEDTSLRASTYNMRVYLDTIFVLDDSSVYGASIGAILGFGVIDQALKTSLYIPESVTKPDYDGEFGWQKAQPIVPMMHIDIGLMGRFFPVNNLSIGLGFVLNVVMNDGAYMTNNYTNTGGAGLDGDPMFPDGAFMTNLIQPMFGTIVPELLLEVTSTRFFGNVGVDFGMHVSMLFSPMLFGIGGSVGVRYRFSPY